MVDELQENDKKEIGFEADDDNEEMIGMKIVIYKQGKNLLNN